MRIIPILIIGLLLFAACGNSHDYSPKPRGYFRIELPKKAYREYVSDHPFTFQYPTYAVIEKDTQTRVAHSLLNMNQLLNMQFKQLNGTLHLSYESITSKKVFDELVEDAHKFAFKNTVKATDIDQGSISIPAHKVYGIYYTIGGNAASSVQFFLTDSVKNYMRGALYFNTEPRLDSIQPVLNFVKKDINVMIATFKWKK
ncbi:gliding motility lipoprotein GldD [Mucilaginibacter corticis]|uniref:Gliding motility lipoprotein GldD n=1 Tax=Mucilaginibacter corticis TaxID=2597670 RepID=A0A556MT77_9SPHI|nr:gliding motility lipoprotein GldD [Mucilaginibacter corticis]TSJ42999.1 gliding motility lipoprotein GldD [Mucilaginibacter corticis]